MESQLVKMTPHPRPSTYIRAYVGNLNTAGALYATFKLDSEYRGTIAFIDEAALRTWLKQEGYKHSRAKKPDGIERVFVKRRAGAARSQTSLPVGTIQ